MTRFIVLLVAPSLPPLSPSFPPLSPSLSPLSPSLPFLPPSLPFLPPTLPFLPPTLPFLPPSHLQRMYSYNPLVSRSCLRSPGNLHNYINFSHCPEVRCGSNERCKPHTAHPLERDHTLLLDQCIGEEAGGTPPPPPPPPPTAIVRGAPRLATQCFATCAVLVHSILDQLILIVKEPLYNLCIAYKLLPQ